MESFITDFSQLRITSVYAVNDPEEKMDIFNTLISGCLDKHAPVIRIRVTRPPAPWMKDLNITSLQAHRNVCRYNAHQTGSEGDWQIFRDVRNQLKKVIKETKKLFYYNALSSKSVVRRALNKSQFHWLQARKKGLMTGNDHCKRLKFVRTTRRGYPGEERIELVSIAMAYHSFTRHVLAIKL